MATGTVSSCTVNVDGGARGNPGPAGWGAVVRGPSGETIAELSGAIPYATNNVAEYQGLISALEWCLDHGATQVQVRSDSLLLVQQMKGVYKVKNDALRALHGQARLLAHRIGRVDYEHVRRAQNADADRLANFAMDQVESPPSTNSDVRS